MTLTPNAPQAAEAPSAVALVIDSIFPAPPHSIVSDGWDNHRDIESEGRNVKGGKTF